MAQNTKHFYGKDVNTLTEKENKMLTLDKEILAIFLLMTQSSPFEKMMLMAVSAQLTNERAKLSAELLNLKREDFDGMKEMLDHIETTDYGFRKFLKDNKEQDTKDAVNELISHISSN